MATTFDLKATQQFPEGTAISAYPASNWPPTSQPPSGAAVGSATGAGATMTSGVAAFTGLADDTRYFFGASVGGAWRYVGGRTAPAVTDIATQGELDSEAATRAAADATFLALAKLQPTDFSDANVPVWDATAGKFVAEPRGAIKRVENTTALLLANTFNPNFAARGQWATAGAVKPFDAFSFTMPNYTVLVEFYAPHVNNATIDKHTFVLIEKNDGSQSSPGFVTAPVQNGAVANVGHAVSVRCLLHPGVEYAVGATVSLRLSGYGPASTGQMNISGAAYGTSYMEARRATSQA